MIKSKKISQQSLNLLKQPLQIAIYIVTYRKENLFR